MKFSSDSWDIFIDDKKVEESKNISVNSKENTFYYETLGDTTTVIEEGKDGSITYSLKRVEKKLDKGYISEDIPY